MLFNSYVFLFFFLPVTLIGFHLIGKKGFHKAAVSWLVSASLFFYGWWNPEYLGLILGSILFNYAVGFSLLDRPYKLTLCLGVAGNLGVLGYFKYANFFIDNINVLTSNDIILEQIILPLGISFFTFQQITYLIDAYHGETREYSFLHYCLFVVFFPQLIAGPIVHHKEMLPQFAKDAFYGLKSRNLAVGFTIFIIGLFKKVVLADGIAIHATPVFTGAENGLYLTFFEAWGGALAYSFQLYFDFSGYSDMAIGLARMFGITLPFNFLSPYKANNIAAFWRHWHITLSRLIKDYLFYPITLSLTRYTLIRNYGSVSLFILTVLLPTIFVFFWVGLWHGAGWNFILFGLAHGTYIVIYSAWVKIKKKIPGSRTIRSTLVANLIGRVITFLAVVLSFVLFRAQSMDGVNNMLAAMLSGHGLSLSPLLMGRIGNLEQWLLEHGIVFHGMFHNHVFGANPKWGVAWIVALLLVSMFFPNTQQLLHRYRPALETFGNEVPRLRHRWIEWRPTIPWAFFTFGIFIIAILSLTQDSEFLYFQF
jgi:alginate O-acetyltransferase complex protein AlgI